MVGDVVHRPAADEQPVNQAHSFGFLGNDLRQAVRAFTISEKGFIRQADLSVCKALALSPSDVLGNAAAFFLCQRGHNRYQQFALAVEGIDTFLLKIDLGAVLLELADGGQTVNGVAGKAADGFGDYQVDFAIQRVGDHTVETFAFAGVGSGNAFIGVNADKFPFGLALNKMRVIIDLCLVGIVSFITYHIRSVRRIYQALRREYTARINAVFIPEDCQHFRFFAGGDLTVIVQPVYQRNR